MERWEFLVQGLALLAVVVWSSRTRETLVDLPKYNRLLQKITQSSIPKTEEDQQNIQKLGRAVFEGSNEADAPQTLLKTKFDPSPLGMNEPNPDYRPLIRDLRKKILKKELQLDKAELKGQVAMEAAQSL